MKLTLIISSLEQGGAERILSMLASAWVKRGAEVTLVTFDDGKGAAYSLDPAIILNSLGVPNSAAGSFFRALGCNGQRVCRLRRVVRQSRPDVVISFLDFPNIITLLATRGLGIPVIVSERANPEYDELKQVWKVLRRLLYPLSAALVCQTSAMIAMLQEKIKVQGYAIPNPVVLPASFSTDALGSAKAESRTLIAMGRLVPQKGFDMLLEAFSKVAGKHPEWSLKVLGRGPLKAQLEAQAELLGLKNRVNFAGALPDPFPVLREADLFVFPSRFEGFGNALIEAMACGLPVISFDCPAGPSDIILHGVNGVLVPREDVTAFAAAMDRLMSEPAERARLACRAPEVLQRFSLGRILGMWDEVIDHALWRSGRRKRGLRQGTAATDARN
ncbi:MAG TPA: glycosyltransferase family 4 protein [Candidatus Angelobacter sp.]|jgi:glycosyltransferase involved in cell wall biosynthesis|nr:glycosyltransferase family 4 protein [Candidatus Angelobacter sp.]